MNVALIPARAGSKRLKNKNFRILGGRSLFEWTLAAALQSRCYDRIVLATDHPDCQSWTQVTTGGNDRTKVSVFVRSPVSDTQPDLEWILEVQAAGLLDSAETFSILRPTSPFRSAETIRRAWKAWDAIQAPIAAGCHSLRSVRPVSEHPAKMWLKTGVPLGNCINVWPWDPQAQRHNQPTQSLPDVYIQTGGLEIALTGVLAHGTISGGQVLPFIVDEVEGLDINSPADFAVAEWMLASGMVKPS